MEIIPHLGKWFVREPAPSRRFKAFATLGEAQDYLNKYEGAPE